MKSRLLALAASAFLAACSTTPSASLSYGDPANPGRVTGVTGLESHDVANVMNYGSYTQARTTAKQKEVCSFTAVKGMAMNFSGVESIKCFAPESEVLARPDQAKTRFERNTAAVGGLIRDSKDVILGTLLLEDRKDGRESAERMQEANNALTQSENANRAAFNREALEAAAVPTVIVSPEGSSVVVTPVP